MPAASPARLPGATPAPRPAPPPRRRSAALSAAVAAESAASGPGGDPAASTAAAAAAVGSKGSQRAARLEVLVQLRKLYRNLLRAESLLEQPSPVYQPVPRTPAEGAATRRCWRFREGLLTQGRDEKERGMERGGALRMRRSSGATRVAVQAWLCAERAQEGKGRCSTTTPGRGRGNRSIHT